MSKYKEIKIESIALFETCARHESRQKTRALQSIYLCDACTEQLVREAFNNRPPVFEGETLEGYCGLCNHRLQVTMRQWFVCGICWNVVLAYQKSIAASEAILYWWKSRVQPQFPHLELLETERVYLSPYKRRSKTKKQEAEALSVLDFLVVDITHKQRVPLFHIEQKTGPGAIDEIKKFQLDVNDFNDIVGASKNTKLPSYIVHVQAGREYMFPTSRTVIRDFWWTDIFSLQKHQLEVKNRRGEDKKAIYYSPKAFNSIDTFVQELSSCRYQQLTRLQQESSIEFIK